MGAIYRKEISQFLSSLIAYVVIAVFLTGIGLLMWVFPDTSILDYGYAEMDTLFTLGPFVFLFLIPAITMRMLAEERKTGTIELLLTRPVSDAQIIFGKYLAAFTLVIFSLLPTLIYVYSVSQLGNPVGNLDMPGIIGSYVGMILLGGVFTAIGLLSSSLNENQIVAFVIAVFLCFAMYTGISSVAALFPAQWAIYIEELSLSYHYEAMSRGLIDSRNLVFFFSTIGLTLLLTHLQMARRMMERAGGKKRAWGNFGMGLLVVLAVNAVSANYFFRWDLTEEKRYSITSATKSFLSEINAPLEVDILIPGDLNPGFTRLQKATVEMLEEFEAHSNVPIIYRFRDPGQASSQEERNANIEALMDRGLSPSVVVDSENGAEVQKMIFPYAIIRHEGRAAAVLLLKGNPGVSSEQRLNQSIEGIEFELARGIQRLTNVGRKQIGFIQGHGELDSVDVAAFEAEMLQFYDFRYVDLNRRTEIPPYDAIIVAKPTQAFSREDKYKIDQYLMKGGKAIFLIDALGVNPSAAGGGGTQALPYDLDLTDLFFRYGIRFNTTFIQDLNNFGRYPVVADDSGTIINLPFPFYSGINRFDEHPISRNLDAVYFRFFGTIDTVKADGVRKTPLMYSSEVSRVVSAPVRVAFEDWAAAPNPELFSNGSQPVAYLLEGEFTSLFKNRILPESVNSAGFVDQSNPTKIVVVSDGDLIRNERDLRTGSHFQLGFNPYAEGGEQRQFANEDFMFNALAYLIDENGLISSRSKELKIRPLNRIKVREERVTWQLINLVLPLALLFVFGVGRKLHRHQKYGR